MWSESNFMLQIQSGRSIDGLLERDNSRSGRIGVGLR